MEREGGLYSLFADGSLSILSLLSSSDKRKEKRKRKNSYIEQE